MNDELRIIKFEKYIFIAGLLFYNSICRMKKIISFTILIVIFFLASQSLFAQKDSIREIVSKESLAKKNDSLNSAILKNFNGKQNEIEQARKSDSLTKADLEKQIGVLQTTDNGKKEELQKQLEALKNKEALALAEKKKQIDALRLTAKGYPVLGFFNDTLFFIFNSSGSFTAEERADAISQRIENLAKSSNFKKDSIQLEPNEYYVDLVGKDRTLMSISDNDAIWENTSKELLAACYLPGIACYIRHFSLDERFCRYTFWIYSKSNKKDRIFILEFFA